MRADACVRLVRLSSAAAVSLTRNALRLGLCSAFDPGVRDEQSVCAQGEDFLEEVVDVKRGGVMPQGQS
jgi:hypothetical protein